MEQTLEQQKQPADKPATRPNEQGSFAVMGHVKIYDPNSQEVLVETRA
jgi:hypothetical protein